MSALLEELGVMNMSCRQRIELAQEILSTVAAEQPPRTHSEFLEQHLQSCIDEVDRNSDDGRPWEEVRDEMLKKFATQDAES